jgi:hypothetical protein
VLEKEDCIDDRFSFEFRLNHDFHDDCCLLLLPVSKLVLDVSCFEISAGVFSTCGTGVSSSVDFVGAGRSLTCDALDSLRWWPSFRSDGGGDMVARDNRAT